MTSRSISTRRNVLRHVLLLFISCCTPILALQINGEQEPLLIGSDDHGSPAPTNQTCSIGDEVTRLTWATLASQGGHVVPGDFIGFGFETAFLNDYAEGTFSENLVDSVAKRLGETLTIRSGGTGGDLIRFDPLLQETKICSFGDCPIGSGAGFVIGPSYFNGFKSFQNQKFSFQAPVGRPLNISNSLEYVTRAYAAIGPERVAAIALGNEPDLNGAGYTAQVYVAAALRLENAIITQLALGANQTKIFEAPDLAGYGNFNLASVFDLGINNNSNIKFAAEHYYQLENPLRDYSPASEQLHLMNHTAIATKLGGGSYGAAQAYIAQNQPDVPYIISESGSSLAGPPRYFQDAFGAALWLLDFNLYAMSIGVKRIDNTQRPATNHSLWVPNASANSPAFGRWYNPGPEVRAPYYALPMLADFLGKDAGIVVEISGDDLTAVYAMYPSENASASKIIIVNFNYWSAEQNTTRGQRIFALPAQNFESVTVKRLHADAGARAQGFDREGPRGNITWAGEMWTFVLDNGEGHFVDGAPQQEVVEPCSGSFVIEVPDSEAVLISFPQS